MKKILSLSLVASTLFVVSCNNSGSKTETTNDTNASATQPVVKDSMTILMEQLKAKSIDTAYNMVGELHTDTLTYTGAEFGDILHLHFTNTKGEELDLMQNSTDVSLFTETEGGIMTEKALVGKKFFTVWRELKKKIESTKGEDWYYNEMTQIIYLKQL
ncbi:MAG: hypothetical protein IPP93_11795 [Chitinophagaceae bacterium]|nr:hypothetical protein [Chitinophagaceae bacterium]